MSDVRSITTDVPMSPSELLRQAVLTRLPAGRAFPVPAPMLAQEVGVSQRTLRALIEDLVVEDGWLIGSVCQAGQSGYFIITDEADLELGIAHLMSRARSLWIRVAALRGNARERFPDNPEILTLFDVEPLSQNAASATAEHVSRQEG